jgi:hypothetical protein
MIKRELKLKLLFTDLAEQSRATEPSPAVKRNLLAELETMRPEKSSRFGWLPRFAIAAAAVACLVLVLLFAHRSRPGDSQTSVARAPVQQAAPVTQTVVVQQPAPVVVKALAATQTTPKVVKRSSRSSEAAQPPSEAANDFYPMVMCDSITCAGPAVTVRVELPASQFSSRQSSGRKVMADLLVGEDGLVRGVRLLQ